MDKIIFFAFLVVFPFGQVIKVGIINPIDIVVGIGAIYTLIKRYKKPAVFTYFQTFLIVAAFSWIVGALLFQKQEVFLGLMYLIRLAAYFYFFIFAYHFKDKKLLLNSLLAVSIISAVFGWVQYLFYPDLRFLYWLGWDDHLNRLVGTFLDPSFMGLILVLGLIIALQKKLKFVILFLLTSIAFTYSRASFLAAIVPLIYKKAWVFLAIFISLIVFLPRTEGEGVRLERTSSIFGRLNSYQESLEIFKKNPVFGVGFNNICLAKDGNSSNHSCSGSESSLLLLLATTGVIGLISFSHLTLNLIKSLKGTVFFVAMVAVFVHSLFSNSLFYPFIMGYLMLFLAASVKEKS
jgi:hypothetical protein